MLLQAQPVFDAHRAVTGGRALRTVYVTPQGTPFTQEMARELAGGKEIASAETCALLTAPDARR